MMARRLESNISNNWVNATDKQACKVNMFHLLGSNVHIWKTLRNTSLALVMHYIDMYLFLLYEIPWIDFQGPLLLTCFNFNPSKDK